MNPISRFPDLIFLTLSVVTSFGQLPPSFKTKNGTVKRSTDLTRKYLSPVRIVQLFDPTGKQILNAQSILKTGNGQADLNGGKYLTLKSDKSLKPWIILDFGREIQGGMEIITTINNSNLEDPELKLEIKEVNAIFTYRDIPYLGSFTCNDERLNQIWMTGAYTVHLNMQDYLWDGIKRDRLVRVGDMHPEIMTINSVFGNNNIVPKSLDLARDITPLPKWMNGISSYSMWWILIQHDWYYYQGDLNYLKKQKEYLSALIQQLSAKIDSNGREILDEGRFLDWPSSENKEAIHAGLQSMMVITFEAGKELCSILGDTETEKVCISSLAKLKKHIPAMSGSKQAAALLSLSGLIPPERANTEILAVDGVHRMSTFYGYDMLKARAKAGDYQGAIDNIREYWGGMLDLGATTFWEDFDINRTKNGARIDEVVPAGKIDVHSSYGGYCYKGFRHSFCHGWAFGPTSWLTQFVLGVNVIEPGCKVIKIEPHLGDLKWVKGTFPTPYGIVKIEHEKMADGSVRTPFETPKEIKVISPKL